MVGLVEGYGCVGVVGADLAVGGGHLLVRFGEVIVS